MTKDQIDELALRVFKLNDDRMFCDTDKWVTTFTHALLAELAKVQEPIYLFRRKGFTDFYMCGYERLKTLSNEPKLFEVKIVYEHPLPQPDLVAEIERIKTIADNYYAIASERSQQLSAAQASEGELLKALETFFECRGSDSYSCGVLSNEGLALIATHKARKEGNESF